MNDSAELFAEIAHRHLGLDTLEERNSDALDFHEVSVWDVRAALAAAFDAGRESATGNVTGRVDNVTGRE